MKTAMKRARDYVLGFDSRRVRRSLIREARSRGFLEREQVLVEAGLWANEQMLALVERCGPFSRNRRMARRIGLSLLNGCTTLITPVCFRATRLSEFIELTTNFVTSQRDFLTNICNAAPRFSVIFLVPEHEAFSPHIQARSGKTSAELCRVLAHIREITTSLIKESGPQWKCIPMSEMIPDPVRAEQEALPQVQRSGRMTAGEANAAAQYVMLGQCAVRHNALICNHTTPSIRWYRKTMVGVLHNPIVL